MHQFLQQKTQFRVVANSAPTIKAFHLAFSRQLLGLSVCLFWLGATWLLQAQPSAEAQVCRIPEGCMADWHTLCTCTGSLGQVESGILPV